MKSQNLVWIALIAVVAIFIFSNIAPEQATYFNSGSLTECRIARDQYVGFGYECISDCVEITSTVLSCWNSCPLAQYVPVSVGTYELFADVQECSAVDADEQCFLSCLGGSAPLCNTMADTNCDGCVHDNEFPIAINQWLTQSSTPYFVSDLMFPFITSTWLSQVGC